MVCKAIVKQIANNVNNNTVHMHICFKYFELNFFCNSNALVSLNANESQYIANTLQMSMIYKKTKNAKQPPKQLEA